MCEIAEPDDYCQIWTFAEVRARKAHRCDTCRGAISPGDKYWRHKSLFDGMWTHERQCAPCAKAEEEFSAAHDEMSWSPSGFADALSDCISEEDEESGRWQPMLDEMRARRDAARAAGGGP